MRKAIDPQRRLDCAAITDVSLNVNCRDEIIPILQALQHIYSRPEVRQAILQAIGRDVNRHASAKRGRRGLDYWPILVLAAVRLGCNFDYDQLQDLAENHAKLRKIMGIGDWEDETSFDWRRIRDNLCLLRPETIERINQAIVAEGHRLTPEAVKRVRADSFVAETNIHYPTESSLIRDGLGKVLVLATALAKICGLSGWRQHAHLTKRVKRLARHIERIAARKRPGYQQRLKKPYRELLALAETILKRAERLQKDLGKRGIADAEALALEREMAVFLQRTRHVCDTAYRRVILEKQVPNNEKVFSIFEPHTQLYKRGKTSQPVQFGRQVLVYEDAAGFILDYRVLPREQNDPDVIVQRTRKLQKRLAGKIERLSLDKGFHSPENQKALADIIPHPCLPMPGTNQSAEQEAAASVEFRQARQSHPGIESAIGALQSGNGLKRCRDRSEVGFVRYVGMGILGRNLQTLGRLLIARKAPLSQAAKSRRKQVA
jgi:hypothetical protein